MVAMAEKLDPFDVAALERSLNDSATRVSTIWVSFLIFSLYLLIAATTVEHRQLFLAEPIKLPVLNIELPLWGFFFLAPILLVILHAYVLIQVLLLGRTAAAYNEAVERSINVAADNARVRQRLANTLFAQIFAGSPREREGWLGGLLMVMAWITLALAPILILLVFQFAFLPYHSHLATWTHRLLILVEVAAFFLIWPLALDARRDFKWPDVWTRLKRAGALPPRLLGPEDGRRDEWLWLRAQAAPVAACLLLGFVSLSLATFPGEWHVNLFTGHWPSDVQCKRWVQQKFKRADLRFDRLILPRVDIVDDEKLNKIADATKKAGEQDSQGERTRILRDRDLNCGDLSEFADLRRVDLAGAHLKSATLDTAKLHGASLVGAQLQGASLDRAELQGASLESAQLQGASLYSAQLQGDSLESAHLQGANLVGAHLEGASLVGAHLQGASLSAAQLQGASLAFAQLQGADLDYAQLQGASLVGAHLQGANLDGSFLDYALFPSVYVWRAKHARCQESRVSGHKPDAVVAIISVPGRDDESVKATPDEIAKFIERSVAEIPDRESKERARARMRAGLSIGRANDDTAAIEEVWSRCETASEEPSREEFDRKFDQNHTDYLRKLVCEAAGNGKAIANGIIRNWILSTANRPDFSARLARGLLGEDGKECAASKDLEPGDIARLRSFVPVSQPASAGSAKVP
jgi:uncharacterized protein YjbI with pentapeptide repeats